jgi:drug/metabolite transporter (DMT)-like permease
VAVCLWSLLASLTALAREIPPFQLAAMSFAIAGALGCAYIVVSGKGLASLRFVPLPAWALGVAGLFGYHFLYFLALRTAPALEANLLNYLWPLLIVLFSALLPAGGKRQGLRWWHLAGALLGLAGTLLILTAGGKAGFSAQAWGGYMAAAGAAFVWAFYSVLSRHFAHVPSSAVAGYCLLTAVAAALCHLVFETTVWPSNASGWAAVAGLGAGPVGLAFYVWDHGVKHGDIRVLGAAAYATPLLSTLLLVLFGLGQASPALWAACALITGGAILAAWEMLAPGRQ